MQADEHCCWIHVAVAPMHSPLLAHVWHCELTSTHATGMGASVHDALVHSCSTEPSDELFSTRSRAVHAQAIAIAAACEEGSVRPW